MLKRFQVFYRWSLSKPCFADVSLPGVNVEIPIWDGYKKMKTAKRQNLENFSLTMPLTCSLQDNKIL